MLNNVNAVELNETELLDINGGNWLGDAWDWCCEHKYEIIAGVGVAAAIACGGAGLMLMAAAEGIITGTAAGLLGGAAAGAVVGSVGLANMEKQKEEA
ncbi:MAG: hypothetical protein CW338_07000 [Clostridiales bacterium]|nr:hypothetical protein [Clostridiales bacterium]